LTVPNIISLLRIALIPLFVALLLVPSIENRIAASIIFALLAASDALDGYLARRLNAVSVFGKFIDPLADKILVISALLALIELNAASSIPVMIIVAREFIVTAFRLSAAGKGVVIPAEILGKLKTVMQMAAVLWLMLVWPYGTVVLWIAVLMTVISGVDYLCRSWGKVF